MFMLGAVMSAVAGVVLVPAGLPLVGLVMLVVAAALVLFTTVTVTIDEHGLAARSWMPLARVHFPLDRIEAASVADIEPWKMGGWGYRGSVTAFGRAAWTLRSGPGIRLDLSRGRRFVVSVDDPEPGVALLQRLLTPRSG
jgi:hypothetical protein